MPWWTSLGSLGSKAFILDVSIICPVNSGREPPSPPCRSICFCKSVPMCLIRGGRPLVQALGRKPPLHTHPRPPDLCPRGRNP